jgi:hypothetical protein
MSLVGVLCGGQHQACKSIDARHNRCMIEKEFENITKEDIDALVKGEIPEGRTIEYKERLPVDSGDFVADASAFGNAGGGDLIYGIREKRDDKGQPTGIPDAAEGLAGINSDTEERRLLQMLQSGIEPRIPGVRIKHIDGFASGGPVIILRIPQSWASPHMVKKPSPFYFRVGAMNQRLDVREIRAAFLASESLSNKISAFRSDRVGKVLAGETPLQLEAGPKIVLHLLPVRAFGEPAIVDLRAAESSIGNSLVPMGPRIAGRGPLQFNFSGLFCNSGTGADRQTFSYVQLFRNGAIEAVCKWLSTGKVLSGTMLDQELLRTAPAYINLQSQLGAAAPTFIAMSAVSVKGFTVLPNLNPVPVLFSSARPIEQDVLLAPESLIEEAGAEIRKLLRPALDTIWQASGWRGSQGYDESGTWVGYGPGV